MLGLQPLPEPKRLETDDFSRDFCYGPLVWACSFFSNTWAPLLCCNGLARIPNEGPMSGDYRIRSGDLRSWGRGEGGQDHQQRVGFNSAREGSNARSRSANTSASLLLEIRVSMMKRESARSTLWWSSNIYLHLLSTPICSFFQHGVHYLRYFGGPDRTPVKPNVVHTCYDACGQALRSLEPGADITFVLGTVSGQPQTANCNESA